MIVLRIEHKEYGQGPYACTDVYEMFNRIHESPHHPGPDNDGINVYDNDFFGFNSKEQLDNWFNKEEKELMHEYGFVKSIYEVEEKYTQSSSKQLIFKKENAVLVNTEKII